MIPGGGGSDTIFTFTHVSRSHNAGQSVLRYFGSTEFDEIDLAYNKVRLINFACDLSLSRFVSDTLIRGSKTLALSLEP